MHNSIPVPVKFRGACLLLLPPCLGPLPLTPFLACSSLAPLTCAPPCWPQVWALDSLPGEVRSGESDRRDHPADLIDTLRAMPLPIQSRHDVTDHLEAKGRQCHLPGAGLSA